MEGFRLIFTITTKVITWILVEVFLNVVGLDNLADYSEYIFTREDYGHTAIVSLINSPRFAPV